MLGRVIGALILGLGGVAVLVSLGIWQVQRLAWKEGVLADIEARIVAEPVALPEVPDPQVDRYLPVVAEGALDLAAVEALAASTDFFGIGPEIWSAEDPAAALRALTAPLR